MKSNLAGKKVLVTGHTGFKGSWLVHLLARKGAKVYGYSLDPDDRNFLYEKSNVRSLIEGERFADICNYLQYDDYFNRVSPDIVFHLAAQPLVRESYSFPKYTFETNAIGTLNVLESLKTYNKKCSVICITTDKVYDNPDGNCKSFKEDDKLGGYDPYSASKAAAEIIIDSYRSSFFNPNEYGKKHQIQIASVRAGNVIGGGDFAKDRIIVDIVKSALSKRPTEIRNPNAVRPWQHVLEPLNGYMMLAEKMEEKFDPRWSSSWNFGPEDESSKEVKYILEKAREHFNDFEWKDISDPGQLHEAGVLKLDISKAKTVLGWSPKWNVDKALSMTFKWYEDVCVNRNDPCKIIDQQIGEYENE